MLQEPGPRGSPQLPQAPIGGAESFEDAETAKTESCLSRSWPSHVGQAGWRDPVTSVSNLW